MHRHPGGVRPNWPVKQLARYSTYVTSRFSWLLTPNSISRAWSAAGFAPRSWDRTAVASFPGISLGMRKLIVSATHRVIAKSPSRRSR